MNKIKRRTLVIVMMAILLVVGFLIFLIRYESDGAAWAGFPSNDHTHDYGIMTAGRVRDSHGELLLSTVDRQRSYADDWTTRVATLHAVGDREGFIGGSAVSLFEKQLMGYSMINGVYSVDGSGRDVYLTIDAELNRVAWQALNGRNGCVAVMNYKTGAILTMVSAPAFDPANPPEEPSYLNRFLSGLFPPGSIFKLVTAQAALETLPVESFHYTCTGSANYEDGPITCQETHGELDFYRALAVSCNCAFADLSQQMGGEILTSYVQKAGLTSEQLEINGFSLPGGSFSAAEDGSMNLGWAGIGQYHDLINPAAMLRYVSAIANGGKAVEANLLKKVTTSGGIPTRLAPFRDSSRIMSEATANELAAMMANNVSVKYGEDRFPGLAIAAKSGTAEVAAGSSPHAWFTGFLASDTHPYAFIVLVENGGSGSSVAGDVANKVLQAAVSR